ncbi:MAG: bis(5'-nucleosyl)-tetraphosphatase (symmetrical) YqeK [Anaerosomatales bacterium]|nr:bis(5'-nucleosyl)-tetraphosphatase (symmetrical) YqeK [Anaerosomatales bacterium]
MALPEWETMRAALEARLSRESYAHSQRVAETASSLAATYDADVALCRAAGLLHDWCRDLPHAALIDRAEVVGVPVGPVERCCPYLLHAPLGAHEVSEAFPGIDERVVSAIAAHTYGAEEMDAVARIVYIADGIEPARAWEGVDALRADVGIVDLGELFAAVYARAVRHLLERRRPLHPVTAAVWNRFVAVEP